MKADKSKKVFLLFLTVLLLCTSCGKEEETAPAAAKATTMSLMKTEGSVKIDDRDGKEIEPVDNLKLYSGYDMFTKKTSYAWINLDRVKLAKMDEKSEIKIQKDEKRLEIHVSSGSLFFDVKEPLKDDETMNIRNSTMAVGIRGTCGWIVQENAMHSQVYILEGTVTVQTKDGKTSKVHAGQKADVTVTKKGKIKLTISKFTVKDIPEFVLAEILQDEELADKIREASGLDVRNPDAVEETEEADNTEETNETQEAEQNTEQDTSEQELAFEAYNAVIEEYRNLLADAGELNRSGVDHYDWLMNYSRVYSQRYPNTSEGYMDYLYGDTNLYYTYHDLDGNGIDELIIGHLEITEEVIPISIHTFDGTRAVTRDASYHELLGDGLLLETGNGYWSGKVYQIGSDGYTWEEKNDSGIPSEVDVRTLDLSSHGGFLRNTLEWTVFN